MSEIFIIAWRNLLRNKRRTFLCVFAVTIAVFFNIAMQSMNKGMYHSIENIVVTYDTGHISITDPLYENDKEYYPVQYPILNGQSTSELITRIKKTKGVKEVLPRISVFASLFDSTIKHALVWGIDSEKENNFHDFNILKRSDGLLEGRYPSKLSNECAIGFRLAQKAGLRIGDSIPLKMVSAYFSDVFWSPVITGIFEYDYQRFDEDTIVVPIDTLRRILGLDEGVQQLVVYVHNERESSSIRNALQNDFGDTVHVTDWKDNYWIAMFNSMTALYIIIFAVFQIVASFLIINTMLMIIHERIKEIGMMGSLGMTRFEIVFVFFLEAVFLSVLGATVGASIGGIVTYIGSLFPLDMNILTGGGMKEFPMSSTLVLDFSWITMLQGFIFGVFVSALCTIFPSMKSAFVEPVEALRR